MESRARVQEIKKKFETLKSDEEKNILNNKNNRGQVKRSPAFRSCKFSLPMKSQDELTDTLKKKLAAPLPKGPAPAKPPRTFAHSSRFPDGVAFTRSKTEPHIMLKKIESALLKNQSVDRPGPRSLNGFSQKAKNGNCLSFANCKKEEPVYTEPYAPKILNDQPQRPKTLHYMSSPITVDPRFHNGVKPKINLYEDNVKNLQVKMLEPFNNNTETDSDGDSVKIKHAVEERKIYAKRNCSIKNFNNHNRTKSNMINALLLIGIDYDDKGHLAYIKERYPSNINVPDNFARLVFPDAENWKNPEIIDGYPEEAKSNNYTIFITASDGSRSYAYCRRIRPEGSPVCLPLAYAILTDHRPNTLYYKVLDVIESKHGVPKSEFNEFIRSLLEAKVPKFNESLIIGNVRLNRCIDEREESTDISTLLKTLSVPVFIKILSCLLLERKVILVGSFVCLLSTCVEGLLKSLHPFTWQHTIISILPISMSEILQAPTPYIIGLIKSKNQNINNLFSEVEDVIVCDIDKGKIIKDKGDENSILPEKLGKALHSALYLVPVRSTDLAPSEALLRLFVELVGHYNNHLISSVPNKNKRFQKENFIKAPSAKSVRLYLEWFVETALFHHFIRERSERTNDAGLFERKCAEHVERQLNKSRKGLKNFF